jgi:hypothetical protein
MIRLKGEIMLKTLVSRLNQWTVAGIAGAFALVALTGCSSGPAQTPESFMRGFLAKHLTAIDLSAADFYAKEERPVVRQMIEKVIASKKSEGEYALLKKATYDLNSLTVEVLGEKEEYVDDMPVTLLQVRVTGPYTMMLAGDSQNRTEDEVFVLESIRGEWRLTQKIKPWI